ncbi:aminoglycoside phosphotransferase family protein [Streptomyces roseolilacinus]|uniref:Phosphotransferase n=1 Tax=Streptomyces roseolilacinus TaxID=66904 RepID=A0A918B007_9ACTN|nr:aminoglycoside phosphotransferase family protein [Streptomyces roseolilacinus]GGQ08074.1 phosphotransferase [Streptomyces roseolilacinus]
MTREHVLQEAAHRTVVRVGDTVRRPVQPWTPAVHALLRHLQDVGFTRAPRVRGVDGRGREVLEYLPGESGPAGWAKVVPDAGLTAFARLLRDYHQAVREFRPPPGLLWCTGAGTADEDEPVCHGDFGPWNVVWNGGEPTGLLDFDYARPAPPLHDVAYALEYAAPFRPDTECVRWLGYAGPPDRRRRLELFADAYGLTDTTGLVDAVIAVQLTTRDLVRSLAAQGHQPQADQVRAGLLDALARRAAWSRAHRHLFTR